MPRGTSRSSNRSATGSSPCGASSSLPASWRPIVLLIGGGIPARGFVWAAMSGLTHVPYCIFLAKAYNVGDFSRAYPIARGGGALLAGLGGIVLLGDTFTPVGVARHGRRGDRADHPRRSGCFGAGGRWPSPWPRRSACTPWSMRRASAASTPRCTRRHRSCASP